MVSTRGDFTAKRWLRGGSYSGPVEIVPLGQDAYLAVFSHVGQEYFVPLARREGCSEKWLTRIGGDYLCEAEFCESFVENVLLRRMSALNIKIFAELNGPVRFLKPLAEEATNPHALFEAGGKTVVVKGYRVRRGWNPEPLFLSYLSGTGLAPRIYAAYGFENSPLGIVVDFIEGKDPGSPVFQAALSCAKGHECSLPEEGELVAATLAEFHSHMLECREGWCAPSVSSRESVAKWLERVRFYLSAIRSKGVSDANLEELAIACTRDMDDFEGQTVLRVHQDFHFSQTLVTRDRRVIIVDFEGEPARPAWAAVELEPGIRDLATLLRALSYISFFSLAQAHGKDPSRVFRELEEMSGAVRRVKEWGAEAAEKLAKSYARRAPKKVLPTSSSEEALKLARPWFIERALYEIMYELEYRQGMVGIAKGTLELDLPPVLAT